ncbi:toxin VasX [Halomonas sp. AOP22-C1-8]|uniref:toxin VasX n=1 Tax=Halomonas sp. AOP22-C1-8 TaxID=3457717 RepID=UPI004033DE85
MSGVLGNPACEGEKLFIQVMGKDHPEGHEIVIVNQHSGERLDDFGEAETEKLSDPTSVLHKWCWQGLQRVDAQLHIATEAGEPIKLPLLKWLYKNERKPRYQDNIIQPVMPMALFQEVTGDTRHALPLRSGYLYIYFEETLWRELEVSANDEESKLEFRDVHVAEHRNELGQHQQDRRPAVGVPLEEVWLPYRQEERAIDGQLRVAFSEVQLSAARLNYLETDQQARLTRCQSINLSSSNNFPSLGMLYLLEGNSEQRLRLPFLEENIAFPSQLTSDLEGSFLQQLRDQAAQELQVFDAGGEQARASADAEMARAQGQSSSPLYLQAFARLAALGARLQQESGDEKADNIWQEPLGSTSNCLSDITERNIPGLVIQDTLFELRHAMRGTQSSLGYLQQIPSLAAEDELYECAALVNQTILKQQNSSGETNPLNRFADKADLSDTGELHRILRGSHRALARYQFDAYQQRLSSLLLSRPGTAVLADLLSLEGHDYIGAYSLTLDLLEGLRESAERADSLNDSTPTALSRAQQLLVNILSDNSNYALHAMLFPSDESTPLNAPLSLPEEPEEDENRGDGLIRLKAISEQHLLDPPTEDDDVQLLETAWLAALASDGGETLLSPELKRWGGVVDLLFGRLAEQVEVLFDQSAQQAIVLPVARLARVGFPELYGQLTATRGVIREDVVILGVKDNAGQLRNGLTAQERDATQRGAQAQARQSFESAVRDASGKTLTPSQARRLAAAAEAAGQQHLTVLVAETNSKAVQLSRRARHQLSFSKATESLRLPYLIAAFELFNVRQELISLNVSQSRRGQAGAFSAVFDLTIASSKAAEFYGERHQRLQVVRARVISRHFLLGDALVRSQSSVLATLGGKLKGAVSLVNFAGVLAGAVSSVLLAWDAWNRFQHGNVGAGIALSLASISSLVVAGSALFKTSPLWLGLGPVGWIALGLSLAAALIAIKLTDNDIEEWLRLGPFGTNGRYDWRNDPADAFERLVSLFANIRIRVEPIGAMTAEMVATDGEQRPAIGILSQSPSPTHAENLIAEQAANRFSGPIANTRVVVNSNLPGLAPGWEQVAHFRFEQTTEYKHEFRKDGYSQWIEDGKELGDMVQPLFERSTTDGREYYLYTPVTTTQPGSWRSRERRTQHKLKVRVQWQRQNERQNSVELPRMLPAPKPTQTASGNPLIPDFTRTQQPYWADEMTHQDNESAND